MWAFLSQFVSWGLKWRWCGCSRLLCSGKDGRCVRTNGCAETCFDWGKFTNWASIESRGKIDEGSTMAYLKRQRRILTHHLPVPLPSLLLLLWRSLSSLLLSSPLHSTPLHHSLFSPLHMSVNALLWQRHPGQLGWRSEDHSDDFRQIFSVAQTFNENLKTKKREESECACLCLFTLVHAMSKDKKSTNAVHHRLEKICHKNVLNQPEKASQ